MKRKFALKKYLTLNETSDFLTLFLNESVSDSDVLSFCLEGMLISSVLITANLYGLELKPIEKSQVKRERIVFDDFPANDVFFEMCVNFEDGRIFEVVENIPKNIVNLTGLCDLPMEGGGRLFIEDLYFGNVDHIGYSKKMSLDGVFMENNNFLFKVMDRMDVSKKGERVEWMYFPCSNIPESCMLVFKMENMQKFINNSLSILNGITNKNFDETVAIENNKGEQIENMTTLQAIGIMAELLAAENSYKYRKGEGNVNAKAIGDAVAARAKIRFSDDVRGFDSFNRKISEGLKALEEKEKK